MKTRTVPDEVSMFVLTFIIVMLCVFDMASAGDRCTGNEYDVGNGITLYEHGGNKIDVGNGITLRSDGVNEYRMGNGITIKTGEHKNRNDDDGRNDSERESGSTRHRSH